MVNDNYKIMGFGNIIANKEKVVKYKRNKKKNRKT
jgi:hypothetical protein